ncbi:hypothetical protein WJ438_06925 [Streptomyces sp. GD-15H]|uniref:hypothetical protein n=1 Tax=Streptomyces sp. GD-15H TaxID=3129112 RepID=UPI0032526B27
MSAEDRTYHALLARHDAMRLRQRLLSSGSDLGTGRGGRPRPKRLPKRRTTRPATGRSSCATWTWWLRSTN